MGDIVLTIIMVISTLALVWRVWQDLTIAVSATFLMLSLGGLFLSLGIKIRHLDSSVIARERTMRVNLEEISDMMGRKYENTVNHIEGIVQDLSKRMYR
ncbi:MAG TPA: hypothetical protein VE134_01090 [Methanomicrobiales archaeon]|nr:hypothetical protein [Methanomicrobiales archaeon]